MKKQFGKLSKTQQEKAELVYHQMKPADFDEPMSQAVRHSPDAIWLPKRLVKHLKAAAKAEGEPEYQVMVRRWIEERLQQGAIT